MLSRRILVLKNFLRRLNRKNIILLSLAFLFVLSVPRVFGASPDQLYDEVWRLISVKYVDQTDNSQDWNIWRHKYDGRLKTKEDAYLAIDTMLASLNDPYTRFLDPKEFEEESSSIKGSLMGVGIQIGMKDGNLVVIAPIEGSPADKAGILTDDLILEIDGVSTKGITIEKAADKIRGNKGTQVTLTVKRKEEVLKFTLTRDEIEIKSVSLKTPIETKVPDSIQYIRLSSFISKNAAAEVLNILKTSSKTKKGYILDLRSNPGGLLTNAILMSDMFLQGGGIVSTVDRNGYKDTTRAASYRVTNKPLVVLVNKGSASASEIFSGAMKDNGRAILVGEQTFGKGLVQEINRLSDDAGINITIQKYLTPNGTDIHKRGITPDVEVKLTAEDVKNKDDVQLKEAMRILLKECSEPIPDYLKEGYKPVAQQKDEKVSNDNNSKTDTELSPKSSEADKSGEKAKTDKKSVKETKQKASDLKGKSDKQEKAVKETAQPKAKEKTEKQKSVKTKSEQKVTAPKEKAVKEVKEETKKKTKTPSKQK